MPLPENFIDGQVLSAENVNDITVAVNAIDSQVSTIDGDVTTLQSDLTAVDTRVTNLETPLFKNLQFTGTDVYALELEDAGRIIIPGERTVRIAADVDRFFPPGTQITILCVADTGTLDKDAGAFVFFANETSPSAPFDIAFNGVVTLIKTPFANNWWAVGNIS
jgi:hypothetical protein